jgi:hypothetical protein
MYGATETDKDVAADVIAELGVDGFYIGDAGIGEVLPVRVQWVSGGDPIGAGVAPTGWQPTPMAYVLIADVPAPQDGDRIQVEDLPWYVVVDVQPDGAMWALTLALVDE